MNILNIDTPEGLAKWEEFVSLNEELEVYAACFKTAMEEMFENYQVTPVTLQFLRERVVADYKEELEGYNLSVGIGQSGAVYIVAGGI